VRPRQREQRGHTYGLANALWEAEQQETVEEAIMLAEALLWDDPGDSFRVRDFLIDVLLEAGRWETAIALLARFGPQGDRGVALFGMHDHFAPAAQAGHEAVELGEEEDVWAWTAALLHMRITGPRSARARRAVAAAVQVSPHVFPFLTNIEPLPAGAQGAVQGWIQVAVVRLPGLPAHFGREKALRYVVNHARHWNAAGTEFIQALREAGQAPYDALNDRVNETTARLAAEARGSGGGGRGGAQGGVGAGGGSAANRSAGTQLPKLCAACHTTAGGLKACTRCKAVWYCSRECQKQHWKQHKKRCSQLAS